LCHFRCNFYADFTIPVSKIPDFSSSIFAVASYLPVNKYASILNLFYFSIGLLRVTAFCRIWRARGRGLI